MYMRSTIARVAAGAALVFATASAQALVLDLTSGTDAFANGASIGSGDTYTEDGFQLQMDRAGDHYDRVFIGDIAFHNGPGNPPNVAWSITFGGSAFDLLDIDIAGFEAGGTSITLTGSNGAVQTIGAIGTTSVLGMTGVTFVRFDINPDVTDGIEAVGLNNLTVQVAAAAVPLPGTLTLLIGGVLGLGYSRRRTR